MTTFNSVDRIKYVVRFLLTYAVVPTTSRGTLGSVGEGATKYKRNIRGRTFPWTPTLSLLKVYFVTQIYPKLTLEFFFITPPLRPISSVFGLSSSRNTCVVLPITNS